MKLRSEPFQHLPLQSPFFFKFSPHPHNVPLFLALFLAAPRKKGEKEGRRSARGRFFREPPQWRKWKLVALSPKPTILNDVAGRIGTEKTPVPPVAWL
ncbi:MAG: hypothetical protein J4F39_15135 [Candidatus Latescibacteria bacterium]|nr:hypothetical protein [Candidatus Latescibacterota bacterium]